MILTVLYLGTNPIPRGKREDDHPQPQHHFQTKPNLISRFIGIDGSGADFHTRAGEVFSDADAQSQSCFGVSLPIHRHNLVLHSRCYACQLRSTGIQFQLPFFLFRVLIASIYLNIEPTFWEMQTDFF